MTKYCDSCHTANKDRAKYCCFCKGRFSGVRFGAHTSLSTFPDALPAQGKTRLSPRTPRRERSSSARARTGLRLLLIFLMLLIGPFTFWDSSRSPERWLQVKSSVAAVWQRSMASIAGTMKPLLAAMLTVGQPVRNAPRRIASESESPPASRGRQGPVEDGPRGSPPDASLDAIAAPGSGAAAPGEMECTEVRTALSLCPKK